MRYQIVDNNAGNKNLLIFADGIPHTVSDNHASYKTLVEYLENGGQDVDHVKSLLDARATVNAAFQRLSERITLRDGELLFEGSKIDNALSRHIIRLAREGDAGLTAFVRFMENLALNPSSLSRLHLFKWIDNRDITITDDGMIVAYKSVQEVGGKLMSITSGSNRVIVNDEEVTGYVPNPIGAVVEIERAKVDPNREALCSYGLHVGTWDYVLSFGGYNSVKLKVLVNPRDVVAVPSDYNNTKMRVCRYKIVEQVGNPTAEPMIFSSNPDDLGDDAELFADDEIEEEELEDWEREGFESEDDYQDWVDGTGDYAEEEEEEEPEEEEVKPEPAKVPWYRGRWGW